MWLEWKIKTYGGIISKRVNPWSSRLELEVKTDAKRLALDKGVAEDESGLFFTGGKDDWQKFWETTLAIDQKVREPAWQEAILLLMCWTKDDLAIFMGLEKILHETYLTKEPLLTIPLQKI